MLFVWYSVSVTEWWVRLTALTTMFKSDEQVCPVTRQIAKFTKKQRENVAWYSKSFYSNIKGYNMCLINVAGDGDSEGTHLSVYLYLIKGPHDDKLTWPLREKFKVKLLNQISDCEHHSCTVHYGDDDNDDDECVDRVIDGNSAEYGLGESQVHFH